MMMDKSHSLFSSEKLEAEKWGIKIPPKSALNIRLQGQLVSVSPRNQWLRRTSPIIDQMGMTFLDQGGREVCKQYYLINHLDSSP